MFFYLYAYEPIHAGKGWKNAIVTWYQKFKESVFFRKLFFLAFVTSLILFRTLLNLNLWMNPLSDVMGGWGIWETINYPRSKLGDHADYLFSHLFQQAKISSKKSREEKITLFINRASNSYMDVPKGNPAMTIVSNRRIQFLPTPLYRYQNHTDSSRPRNTHLPPQEKHRY